MPSSTTVRLAQGRDVRFAVLDSLPDTVGRAQTAADRAARSSRRTVRPFTIPRQRFTSRQAAANLYLQNGAIAASRESRVNARRSLHDYLADHARDMRSLAHAARADERPAMRQAAAIMAAVAAARAVPLP